MFLVEDCSGLELANSLATVAEFDDYFTDRGNSDAVALTIAVKQSLLIKGSDYLKSVFEWDGVKYLTTQNLPFPRAVSGSKICTPLNVKFANIELALISNTEELQTNVGQRVTKEKVSSIEVHYSEYSNEAVKYTSVYNLVKPYLSSASDSQRTVIRT